MADFPRNPSSLLGQVSPTGISHAACSHFPQIVQSWGAAMNQIHAQTEFQYAASDRWKEACRNFTATFPPFSS